MYQQALRHLTLPGRSLRTCPGKYMLGPTGARLSADVLAPVPGFEGRLDLIHKMNLPLLYAVDVQEPQTRRKLRMGGLSTTRRVRTSNPTLFKGLQ